MHLERFQTLINATDAGATLNRDADIDRAGMRKRLWLRGHAVESGVSRRAAALLCSLGLASAAGDTTAEQDRWAQSLRRIYAGSIFQPTEGFVRSLHLYPVRKTPLLGAFLGHAVLKLEHLPRQAGHKRRKS